MFNLKPQRIYVRWLLIFCLLALIFGTIVQAADTKKLIDLDCKNSDLKDVLKLLADKGGVNFDIASDVSATVTLHLSKMTFKDILNFLCKQYNLAVEQKESIYYITQIDISVLKIEYVDGKLSVEAAGAKLTNLFNIITQKTGRNLVLDPAIQDRGSILLNKVPLDDAIKALLTQFNLSEEKINQISYLRRKSVPPGSISPDTKIEYQNGKLTLDVKNVPLQTLTRAITEKTNISIVPDPSLNPNVSIFVQDQPIPDALSTICDTNNLGLSKESPTLYRIYKLTNSFRVSYKDKSLSVDADGADAQALFSEISRQSGVQINLDKDLRGQVTIHFKNVALFQGITSIADSAGWVIEKRGSGYQLHFNNNNIKINYDPENKLFDIVVTSAALAQVINEIANKADLNVSVSNQVNWSINSLRMIGKNVYQVFDYLLKGTIFTYKEVDGIFIFSDSMYPRPETVDFTDIKVYTIKYLKADQVMNTLPATFPRQDFMLLSEKNALIVTGPPSVHTMFTEYLNQIDVERIEDRTELIKIKHLKAEDVLKYLPASIPKQDIIVIKEMNALTVSGPQNLTNQIKQYIEKIDQPNPMIVFDIKVIKISNSNELNWNPPSVDGLGVGSNPKNFGALPLKIDGTGAIAALDTLVTKGRAKILQNPIITTLNGSPVSFNVSSKRTYVINKSSTSNTATTSGVPTPTPDSSTETKEFDNSLTVSITPWVAANNQITMEIKPRIREYGAVSESGLPDTSEHATETTIRVNNKQTVMISGLKSTRQEKSVSKVPFFGDIPLLSFLFRKTKNTDVQDEFVIVITPTLVYDDITQADMDQKMEN
jgi:type II secretory pathway component GspD/PulD (secretin)